MRSTEVWIYRFAGSSRRERRWRTLAAFAWTFASSIRVLGEASRGPIRAEAIDARLGRWSERVFRLAEASLVVEGLARLPASGSCVLVSNHQSLLDIPAICASFPRRVRFVAKQELRSVPAFGAAMERAGVIFVDRGNRARAIQQLQSAPALLRSGASLWVAAEGSRSRGDTLGPMKKGAFHVAMALGAPIVPVWIQGTGDILPPDQLVCRTGRTVVVRYGPPVETVGVSIEQAMEACRAQLLELAAAP